MTKKSKEESQTSLEKTKYLKQAFDFETAKHNLKMIEFAYLRESDHLHHEREMERSRIKSAEIRKTLQHKEMNRNWNPN